jgi:hypothetical protein
MPSQLRTWVLTLTCGLGITAAYAAGVSEQQADAFARKMALVAQRGASGIRGGSQGPSRTPFTESEVNSWMTYRGETVLPVGVTAPQVTIIGNGRVRATATVDLEAVARQRSTGRALDPWSYLGGRVPVTLSGVLHTQEGTGRFEVEDASVSGVPVPRSLLQDMVSYYSRTPDDPEGLRLGDPFRLPARIRQIEMGQGQAIVVQ